MKDPFRNHQPTVASRPMVVLGAGYLGLRIAQEAYQKGFHPVVPLKRSPWGDSLESSGLSPLSLDLFTDEGLERLKSLLAGLPGAVIVYALSPDGGTDDAYQKTYFTGIRRVVDLVKTLPLPGRFQVILTSSTSVYSEDQGHWVDETTTALAAATPSRWIVAGEKSLMDAGSAGAIPWTILRYGGLYGPGRRSFVDRVTRGSEYLFQGPPFYSNRIHVEDGARLAVFTAVTESCRNQIFNAVDTAPSDRNEVIQFLWDSFGVSKTPLQQTDNPQLIPHRGNKRCLSTKITQRGFRFQYPTYREGYLALPMADSTVSQPP